MWEPVGFLAGPAERRPGWPVRLGPLPTGAGDVLLRPMRRSDGGAWRESRLRDEESIAPWDASSPLSWADRHTAAMWRSHRALLVAGARRGESLPLVITVDDRFAGQVTLGGIQRGALRSAWIGYWVYSRFHGAGVATSAVALLVAHGFGPVGLHRIEATIAPENLASRAVVGHLGFRLEGHLVRYLDVNGSWRDHLLYAMTAEEVTGGLHDLLQRWRGIGSPQG